MGHRFPRPTAIMPAWCACEIRGRITLRRDGDIAPYRHNARMVRTARAPWYGAAALPRVGMTKRRALRGYRGRTETPPAKLSACATCHYPRALPTATGRCGAMIACGGSPPRPTAITPAKLPAVAQRHGAGLGK